MYSHDMSTTHRTDLKTPVRNRYFYGKLLDTYHFQLETNYLNTKRWLLNRLVSGYGVVCGLDVKAADKKEAIFVTAGLAIDKWGREIIVPKETAAIPIPPELIAKAASENSEKGEEKRQNHESEKFVHLLLCYHECESDPAPVLTGDGCGAESCEPGAIRERYKLIFKPGVSPPISTETCIPDFFSGGRINYPMLAKYVTRECQRVHDNPCIPLANIRVSSGEEETCLPDDDNIDITIRPIVFTNDLLFELLLSLLHEDTYRRLK
jgi:hypothetical protein